jgi:uncharacterized sulfatase
MVSVRRQFFQQYFSIALALLFALLSIRIFEQLAIASKAFVPYAWRYELAGLFYDAWLWFIITLVFLLPCWALSVWKHKAAAVLQHILNGALLIAYLGLLITFSERNTPFDHELFTRNAQDTIDTVKQMMTAGLRPYIPYLVYLPFYGVCVWVLRRLKAPRNLLVGWLTCSLLLLLGIRYANPSPDGFEQKMGYYLTCNKFSYWCNDSYRYFNNKRKAEQPADLSAAISFYQKNHPFDFTSTEYPLLHKNNEKDVLGPFFNLPATPPNVVIMVVEGLSRDFSGRNAYASSFTPFLDSLADKSLAWDNFLSTAPGTFAVHPAVSGSLPYGRRGFSIMNVMPDHLSLIKILKANGYHTKFLIGFNPDFDNMGGYIRLQGTDFILSHYGPQYKEMGVGKEGWSMGYPDDALYQRSLEVMDSIKTQPYLNIFHTATTHLPYLFEQKKEYEKKFDQKLKTLHVTPEIKRTLKQTKEVLVTFMFSDDCLRRFFSEYKKRPDYANTIFLITGDHHIGSFPATSEIDDYRVPLIIYSPLLKKPERFLSVNTHNNIAPTLLSLIGDHYPMQYKPNEVHWMGGVLDTARGFRNTQSMPFMSWSREILDYIWKDYFISDEQLYRLNPDLSQTKIKNDSIKKQIIALRENFKVINQYVCDKNKVFPSQKNFFPGKKEVILSYTDSALHKIFTKTYDTSLMQPFPIPKGYKYLYVEFSADVNIADKDPEHYPTLRFAMVDLKGPQKFLYWSKRDLATLAPEGDFKPGQMNRLTTSDMFTMNDYKNAKALNFDLAVWNSPWPNDLQIRNMRVTIYGIK